MQRFGVRLRRGMTLIELLVVIGIIATLAAVTIPIMIPAVESRRMREAARGVSTFISAARARAVELNRPVGIRLEPLPDEGNAAMTLFYVEQPAPFGGWTAGEVVEIEGVSYGTDSDGVTPIAMVRVSFPSGLPVDLIKAGDLMRLNYQGHHYEIRGVTATEVTLVVQHVDRVPWRGGERIPYQLLRQPVPSAGQPYQLPDGIVVDLRWSGFDANSYPHNAVYLKEVIFAPSGHVVQVRWSDGTFGKPTGAIYLLVGKRENVDASATVTNWADPNTLWITINHQTGQSKAVENMADATGATEAERFLNSRTFARDQMALGGR